MTEETNLILAELAKVNAGVVQLQQEFRASVAGLRAEVADLRTEVMVLKAETVDLRTSFTMLDGKVEQLNKEVSGLKKDVKDLKEDVAVLKGDVAGLKEDVAVLKGDVAGLKEDVAVLKGDVAGLKEDMAVQKRITDELSERIHNMGLLLENEIRHNICIVAENHLNLWEKLEAATRISQRDEIFHIRFNKMESDVRELKQRVGMTP